MDVESSSLSWMQGAFLERFCIDHGIDPRVYSLTSSLPRYIRIRPEDWSPSLCDRIEQELGCPLTPVDWLPTFYALPASVKIVHLQPYEIGQVYGIDAASGCAVCVLDPHPGDRVLDLCCAPGAKLCMVAELMEKQGSILGVDISQERLNVCKNILQKYSIPSSLCDLRCMDALDLECLTEESRYDRILCDVPCTHDGSLKHVLKYAPEGQWSDKSFEKKFSYAAMEEIVQTQMQLLDKAFSCLREGGILVYSTCSFTRVQNEEVVNQFLTKTPQAVLEDAREEFLNSRARSFLQDVLMRSKDPSNNRKDDQRTNMVITNPPCVEGSIQQTIRFDPFHSNTSGLFVARIRRQTTSR